jgi:predicted RecA/RadA family phage recombinase
MAGDAVRQMRAGVLPLPDAKGGQVMAGRKLIALRGIVEHKQHGKVEGVRVDLFTANAIIKVYDALSAENQAKYLALPVQRMANIAFKLVEVKR